MELWVSREQVRPAPRSGRGFLTLGSACPGFSIEGPSQAKIECDDKGDGSCDVHYWPTEPGDYAVHVICDDEDIKDSPFIAHILPAANDTFPEKVACGYLTSCRGDDEGLFPPQVKAFGPGLKPTGVTVNKPTEFTIDARMAGKGHLSIYAQVRRASPAAALGCC